jgi:Flp pilus assembly protein TadB
MLLVLAVIAAVVAGLAFSMGWFHFSSGRATTRMRTSRCRRTKDKAVDKVKDLGQQVKDKVATTTQKAQE